VKILRFEELYKILSPTPRIIFIILYTYTATYFYRYVIIFGLFTYIYKCTKGTFVNVILWG